MFDRELVGAILERVQDCISIFVLNKGCSDVRVMLYGGVAQDGAVKESFKGY